MNDWFESYNSKKSAGKNVSEIKIPNDSKIILTEVT